MITFSAERVAHNMFKEMVEKIHRETGLIVLRVDISWDSEFKVKAVHLNTTSVEIEDER